MSWTWWVVPGLTAALVAWAAAAILLRTRPDRSLNRRLAAVLFLEGLWMSSGVFWLVEDRELFLFIAGVGVAGMAAIPFQYLAFLGVALRTPLVAIGRSRTAFILLGLASGGAALAVLVYPEAFIGELYRPDWATWNFQFRPAGAVAAQILGLASLFGLVASLHSYRRARPGTAARSQAKWFAIAFGVRDLFNAAWWLLYPVVRPIPFWGDFISNQGGAYFTIVYILLLAYGVLRFQLFDLDLKLKLAIRRGTVGAVFAAAFFIGSELLERVVPVEGTLLGLTVAGPLFW